MLPDIDRDALKRKIFIDLRKKRLLERDFLAYRRGCNLITSPSIIEFW